MRVAIVLPLGMITLLNAPVFATSPAGWIGEYAACIDNGVERERKRAGHVALSKAASRKAAVRVTVSCRAIVPRTFNAAEMSNMEGAERYEVALRLQKQKP